jgi:LuxR family transcriptional regulator, maltose regulon positive regulatory protein
VLDGDARPGTRQDVALCLARLAFLDGDMPTATRTLGEALEYGHAERRRRPFLEAGPWVRQLLGKTPELAAGRDWLYGAPESVKRVGSDGDLIEALTRRESEVLIHLARALSTEDIADSLYLSVNTVKTHLKSIYRKLGIGDRSSAARRARELKLLPGC